MSCLASCFDFGSLEENNDVPNSVFFDEILFTFHSCKQIFIMSF